MGTTSPDLTENNVYIHIFICDFEEGLGFRVTYIYIYVSWYPGVLKHYSSPS